MKDPKKTVMTCSGHRVDAEHRIGTMRTHHQQRDNNGSLPVMIKIFVGADTPGR